jgi:hypothetical protein
MNSAQTMHPIATKAGWILLERPTKHLPPWQSFKLVFSDPHRDRRRRQPKHTWWLGHNGERLARNTDAGHLAAHYPEIYAWVLAELQRLTVEPVQE